MQEQQEVPALNNKQIAAIIKLNNVLGYLPIGITGLLNTVIGEVAKLFPKHKCYIQLVELDGEVKTVASQFGNEASAFNDQSACLPAQCSVVRDGLLILGNESYREGNCPHLNKEAKSYLCLPLEGGKEKLGIMHLVSDEAYHFSGVELEVALCIANQTATALQRYRLFQQLEAEKLELKQVNEEVGLLNRQLASKLEELQATQAQLIRAEKLATVGQLTADLAHEINNPIAIILSRLEYLEWQLEEGKQPDNLFHDLKMLQKHTLRIANLTRDLLSFARPKDKNFNWVKINNLIAETCSLLNKQLSRRGIVINLGLDPKVLEIWGNWDQLQQVLVNLIYNSRDAMPGGGRLEIKTYTGNKGTVYLEVSDTGEGIKPKHLDRIFDPFFTTKEEQKGTGLGLSISENIISQHGGQIKVNSQVGAGTTFIIRFLNKPAVKAGE